MRLGANSTVTGAICSVKSVLATSCEPVGARKDCGCWPASRLLAAAAAGNLEKVASLHEKCRKPVFDHGTAGIGSGHNARTGRSASHYEAQPDAADAVTCRSGSDAI